MHVANEPHTAEQVIARARDVVAKRRLSLIPKPKPVIAPDAPEIVCDVIQAPIPVARPYLVHREHPSAEDILDIVADFYCVHVLAIKSKRRTAIIIRPRQVAMYLMREMTLLAHSTIANFIGGRDHTCCLYACRKYDTLIRTDERLKDEIDILRIKISERMTERNNQVQTKRFSYRLPFPVSVNDMFFNVHGKGRVKSVGYKDWLMQAGLMLNAQHPLKFNGRVEISVDLDDTRRGDADNRLKPVADLLVTHGIINDDTKEWVKRVSIGWERVDGCVVTIKPLYVL